METLIWAFGATLVLMVIIFFLPLGFSLKGKFLIVLTGFFLSLGGLAAITSIPLWETALLLTVLIFFLAYFMDSRLGKSLYKEKPLLTEQLLDTEETIMNVEIDNYDKILQDSSNNQVESMDLLTKNKIPIRNQPTTEPKKDLLVEISDEEISFLLGQSVEKSDENSNVEFESETGNLSEIEDTLQDSDENNNWLNELVEMNDSLASNEVELKVSSDYYIAKEEAASSKDRNVEESETLAEIKK